MSRPRTCQKNGCYDLACPSILPRFSFKPPLLFYTLQISASFYQLGVMFSSIGTIFRAESI